MGARELGFGTEYEKFVLGKIFRNLVRNLGVRSVCEYPSNNLMGNNSEAFEKSGCIVNRAVRPSDFGEKYDLVWNFCAFEKSEDPAKLIKDMLTLSRKYIFIVTQNNRNMGVLLHRIYHIFGGKKWDHGSIRFMSPKPSLKLLEKYGKIIGIGYFDVPWFVFDVYECGWLLKKIVPASFTSLRDLRESRFEGLPNFSKSWLAHHNYVLCQKTKAIKNSEG